MRSSTRQAIACILAIISVAAVYIAAHAQNPAKEPGITISGKATVKGKGVRGVNIILRQSDYNYGRREGSTYKAVTDDDGNYRIANVPRGEYRIFALAPLFVPENEVDRERLLIVGKSETVENVDFTLVRGGVITGKVVDSEDRPVVEESVYVVNAADNKFVYAQYNSSTDDRGVYRLYGLRPGSYRVVAGRGGDFFMQGSARAYRQTYSPSATDPAEATIVEVTEGSETRDMDIVMSRTLTTYTVKARLVDGDTGQPVPNVGFGITRYEHGNSASRGWGAVTNARGEIKIDNITPGSYGISIAPPPEADWRVDETRFEIVDHDVTDLVFKTIRSGSVSGVVVLEGVDEKAAREQLKRMTLTGYTEGQSSSSRSSSAQLNEDGSFQIKGLAAGNAMFYLHSEAGVRIDRIERDGVIQLRGTPVKEREHVKGVRLIAQIGNATLRGKIDVTNGTLPPDARFFVWPRRVGDDPNGMYSGNPRSQVDDRGQFVIAGLTPGSYELSAGVFFVSAKVGYKATKEVVVTAGATTDVNITVDLSSTPIKQP
jgi:hypothetical protein